jgi:hypothetical protein
MGEIKERVVFFKSHICWLTPINLVSGGKDKRFGSWGLTQLCTNFENSLRLEREREEEGKRKSEEVGKGKKGMRKGKGGKKEEKRKGKGLEISGL